MKHKILDLSTELISKLATIKRLKADVSSVSPSSEQIYLINSVQVINPQFYFYESIPPR